jgi:hypothetical protein
MPIADLTQRVARIREMMARPDHDAKALHDDVRAAIDLLEQHGEIVPIELREDIEALQAEVVEEFYDNLPL